MNVFFTSENESVSKHSLDTLDSRKKKRQKRHYPANDRPGYNTLQQSVLELLSPEEMQNEKEQQKQLWRPTRRTRSQLTSALNNQDRSWTDKQEKTRKCKDVCTHSNEVCLRGGGCVRVCVYAHACSSRTLWIKCCGDETMRPLYAHHLSKPRAKAALSIPTFI